MPFNLFLLPLLGGFLFLRYWNLTRYHALRAEEERLLILASIPGLITLVISFSLMRTAQYLNLWPSVMEWWNAQVPFQYLGTSLFAFALGAFGWKPLNMLRWCSTDRAIERMIEHDRIPLDRLLKSAQDQGKTVSVTMSNGKVYVIGLVRVTDSNSAMLFSLSVPASSYVRHNARDHALRFDEVLIGRLETNSLGRSIQR